MGNRIEASSLFELSATLLSASAQLDKFSTANGIASPSFDALAPNVPLNSANKPYFDAKSTIVEAAEQIIRLVRGPREILLALSFEHCASASMQVVFRYKFANHIPLQGETTFAAIANAVGRGVTTAVVERTLQHTSSFGLFTTLPGGRVAHNAVSSMLVTDPDLEAWMYLSLTIAYPAGAVIPKAIDQYGVSMEADEAAYGVSIGRKIAQFQRFREPDGLKDHEMFARAMRGIAAGGAYDFRHAVDGGYPWHLLQEGNGHLVVDVGGGPGHVSMALAEKYPALRFEVQDLPETVQVGAEKCPEQLKERVSFLAHDFMTPQPKHDVGEQGIAYFARFILHDWSDKYATKIVQQLAIGLRPQDRIILNEVVVPEAGLETRENERRLHDRDLLMLMNLNGRERTPDAFEAIFASVTPKLRLQKIHRPEQGELSLIEATLDGVSLYGNDANGAHGSLNGGAVTQNGVNGSNGGHTVNGASGNHDSGAIAQNGVGEPSGEHNVNGGQPSNGVATAKVSAAEENDASRASNGSADDVQVKEQGGVDGKKLAH